MVYRPPHVTETAFPSPWTTCALASATMGAAKATRGEIPATVQELDRLWSKIGKTYKGYTSEQLTNGQFALYENKPSTEFGWSKIVSRLADPRNGVILYGSYPLLPKAIRDHSAQPGYTGLHAIYGQGVGNALLDIGDPLARAGWVRVSIASLSAFCASLSHRHTIYQEGSWLMAQLQPGAILSLPTPCVVSLPKGTPIYSEIDGANWLLGYDYRALAIGVVVDHPEYAAYLLNAGGVRYFKIADVSKANRLVTVEEAVSALRKGFTL